MRDFRLLPITYQAPWNVICNKVKAVSRQNQNFTAPLLRCRYGVVQFLVEPDRHVWMQSINFKPDIDLFMPGYTQ